MRTTIAILFFFFGIQYSLADNYNEELVMESGEKIFLFDWVHFDDNCKFAGLPKIVITREPKLGRIITEEANIMINNSGVKRCDGKKYKGIEVYYQSSGKKGTDRLEFKHYRPSNGKLTNKFSASIVID